MRPKRTRGGSLFLSEFNVKRHTTVDRAG